MVGLDVTHRAMLSAARAEALRATGPPAPWSPTSTPSTGGSISRSMGMTTPQCTTPLAVAPFDPPPLATRAPPHRDRHHPRSVPRAHGRRSPWRRTGLEAERPPSRWTSTETGSSTSSLRPDRLAAVSDYPFERRLGAFPLRNGRTEFRVWAPAPGDPSPCGSAATDHPTEDVGFGVREATVDRPRPARTTSSSSTAKRCPILARAGNPDGLRARAGSSTRGTSPGPTTASRAALDAWSSTSCTSARSRRRGPSTRPSRTWSTSSTLGITVHRVMPVAEVPGTPRVGLRRRLPLRRPVLLRRPAALPAPVDAAHGRASR